MPGQYETKRAVLRALVEILTYGLPGDYFETYAHKVRSLQLPDIERAAKAIVHPDHMVWVVVGDLEKIETGVRELEFGKVRRLSAEGRLLD